MSGRVEPEVDVEVAGGGAVEDERLPVQTVGLSADIVADSRNRVGSNCLETRLRVVGRGVKRCQNADEQELF